MLGQTHQQLGGDDAGIEHAVDRKGRISATDALGAVVRWLRALPKGTLIPADAVAERLEAAGIESIEPQTIRTASPIPQVQLWTDPDDRRITVPELAMMLGRPKSYIWRLTATKSIPHRRLDGVIVFVLGEVRAWVRKHEVVG